MPVLTRTAFADADAYSDGSYKATPASLDIGTVSGVPDSWAAIGFGDVQIDRYSKINSASFSLFMFGPPAANQTYHAHLFAAINPAFPATNAALRESPRTTSKDDHIILAGTADGFRTWIIAAALQEQVNKDTWVKGSSIVVLLKGDSPSAKRSLHHSESVQPPTYRQTLTVDSTPPVTGSGATSAPAQTTTGSGSSENPPTTGSGSAAAPGQVASGVGETTNPDAVGSGAATAPDQSTTGTGQTESEPPFVGEGQVAAPDQTAAGEGSSDNPGVSGEGVASAPDQTTTGKAITYLSPPQLDGPLTISPQSELANAVARHMLGLLPPGRKPKEGGYAYFVVLALSALLADTDEAVVQMVRDWSPSRSQNPELLALIGRARSIQRGTGESLEAYRTRVVNASDFWKLGGTSRGIKAALEAAGYGVTITEHYHTDRRRWAEFSVELYPGASGIKGDVWGDGEGYWGDGSKWGWHLSEAERGRVLELIHEMKAAHSKVRDVWYQHGGPKDQWGDGKGFWGDGTKWHGFDPIKIN